MDATKRNKKKSLLKFSPRDEHVLTWRKRLTRVQGITFVEVLIVSVRILHFPFFFWHFFSSSLYYLFVHKKNLYDDLNRLTMLVRSADSTLASNISFS